MKNRNQTLVKESAEGRAEKEQTNRRPVGLRRRLNHDFFAAGNTVSGNTVDREQAGGTRQNESGFGHRTRRAARSKPDSDVRKTRPGHQFRALEIGKQIQAEGGIGKTGTN